MCELHVPLYRQGHVHKCSVTSIFLKFSLAWSKLVPSPSCKREKNRIKNRERERERGGYDYILILHIEFVMQLLCNKHSVSYILCMTSGGLLCVAVSYAQQSYTHFVWFFYHCGKKKKGGEKEKKMGEEEEDCCGVLRDRLFKRGRSFGKQ